MTISWMYQKKSFRGLTSSQEYEMMSLLGWGGKWKFQFEKNCFFLFLALGNLGRGRCVPSEMVISQCYTLERIAWQWKKQPFEDVSPIENDEFSITMLVFGVVSIWCYINLKTFLPVLLETGPSSHAIGPSFRPGWWQERSMLITCGAAERKKCGNPHHLTGSHNSNGFFGGLMCAVMFWYPWDSNHH